VRRAEDAGVRLGAGARHGEEEAGAVSSLAGLVHVFPVNNSSGSFAVHAQHPLLRLPRLQAGWRRGGPAAWRLRPPPWAASGSPLLQLLVLPSPPLLLQWTGGSPQGRRRIRERPVGNFYRTTRLGFGEDGSTAGGPRRLCLGHAAGIPRPQACSVWARDLTLTRTPASRWGRSIGERGKVGMRLASGTRAAVRLKE
jgi:hypothetical protein